MRQNKKSGTRQRSGIRLVGAAALAIFLVIGNELAGHSGYLARHRQLQQIDALTQQIGQLKEENQRLAQRIDGLRSNPATIEEMAREQLHLGKPGEIVVALPKSATPPSR